MKYLNINKRQAINEQIKVAINYLENGKVIAYPTDTIYGLGADSTNARAIRKIQKIKQRDNAKGFIVLMSSFAMIKKYCFLSKRQADYLKNNISKTRPTSAILQSKGILSKEISAEKGSIAVRIPLDLPKNSFLIRMIKGAKVPVVSTSLNISGQEKINDVSQLEKFFVKEKPDLVIDAGVIKGRASRLVDLRDMDNIKILRK